MGGRRRSGSEGPDIQRGGRRVRSAPATPLPAKRGEVRRGAGRLASTLIASPTSPSPYLSPFRFAARGEGASAARVSFISPRNSSAGRRRLSSLGAGDPSPREAGRGTERGRSFSLDAHRLTDQPLALPLPFRFAARGEGTSACPSSAHAIPPPGGGS